LRAPQRCTLCAREGARRNCAPATRRAAHAALRVRRAKCPPRMHGSVRAHAAPRSLRDSEACACVTSVGAQLRPARGAVQRNGLHMRVGAPSQERRATPGVPAARSSDPLPQQHAAQAAREHSGAARARRKQEEGCFVSWQPEARQAAPSAAGKMRFVRRPVPGAGRLRDLRPCRCNSVVRAWESLIHLFRLSFIRRPLVAGSVRPSRSRP
jgi:hypothetical protein